MAFACICACSDPEIDTRNSARTSGREKVCWALWALVQVASLSDPLDIYDWDLPTCAASAERVDNSG
jgi:hypothetical protein